MTKKNKNDILSNDALAFSQNHKQEFVEKAAGTEEDSIIGETADLESDDDMLENAHDMGLYKADDGAHPQELNLAAEIQSAEDNRRGLD